MRQRADRWDHHPVLNIDGDPIRVLRPTDNDLAKFELLTHYRTLSCPFIASILEDDPESDRKRLKVLAAEPNRYLNLYNRDKQRLLIGLNGYQWYTLSRRGVDTLRGRGRDIHGSVEGNGKTCEGIQWCDVFYRITPGDGSLSRRPDITATAE